MANYRPLTELAELAVEIHRQLEPLKAREAEVKDELRNYEGEKVVTSDGSTVSIGRATQDRPTGTQIVFNEQAFLKLNPELRAEIEKIGVVAVQPKITKGQVARVTVKVAA